MKRDLSENGRNDYFHCTLALRIPKQLIAIGTDGLHVHRIVDLSRARLQRNRSFFGFSINQLHSEPRDHYAKRSHAQSHSCTRREGKFLSRKTTPFPSAVSNWRRRGDRPRN